MAVQSLYRRYRPQRFSEIRGQDHVVKALRSAIANGRESHAYLFSGPRGTGKTSTARILAKALNCDHQDDGDACGECDSCRSVEQGNSFDVIELDAASNTGVDDIRSVITSAALGSPGRHKVYIVDEVHMLSKNAAAALLKTLEEPPSHVVFVLATTDPEKVPETIRSRTQHLQFHLLPNDVLDAHVRWVIQDAGLSLDEAAIDAVLREGGGSARDTLSALELAVATGGVLEEGTPVDDFVEALVAYEVGPLLAAVARSVQFGRDPRGIANDLVRHLRDCFLTQMAPELVQTSSERLGVVTEQAMRLGTPRIVKIIETLGQALLDMRHALEARVILEVALVRLVHQELDMGLESVVARLARLEKEFENRPVLAPAPVDPSTGRAVLGGRVSADPSGPLARSVAETPKSDTPTADPGKATKKSTTPSAPPATPTPPATSESPTRTPQSAVENWSVAVLDELKGMHKAILKMADPVVRDGGVVLQIDNEPSAARVRKYMDEFTSVIHRAAGGACPITIEVLRPSAPEKVSTIVDDGDGGPDLDIDEIKSLPTVTNTTITDQLTELFPGSELVSEDD
ncbi:MAG: DNA polymerase III subunit gamma/tau [Actinomycetota bacterium]